MIHKYRVKIFENINLEGDESFLCRDYSYPGEYDQCLQAEYIRLRESERENMIKKTIKCFNVLTDQITKA